MGKVALRLWVLLVVMALSLSVQAAFDSDQSVPVSPASQAISTPADAATLSTGASLVADEGSVSERVVRFAEEATPTPTGFVHPGILMDRDQLDYVKAQVALGNQPWTDALTKAKTQKNLATRTPRLTTMLQVDNPALKCNPNSPGGGCVVNCGSNSNPNNGCTDETVDFEAAYTQTLLWYLTGQESYAQSAIAILNGWSAVLKNHTGSSAELQASWSAESIVRAAEILRYAYTPSEGMAALDVPRFATMLDTAFRPVILAGRYPQVNGNWDFAAANALMSIAVFNDDRALFDEALSRWRARLPAYIYRTSDGPLPAAPPGGKIVGKSQVTCFWLNGAPNCSSANTKFSDGQSQETCRDTSHVAMGFASMFDVAETARLQGVDLYRPHKERFAAGLENVTKLINTVSNVTQYPADFCIGHGTLKAPLLEPTYEIAYNALVNRLGMELPQTLTTIRRLRAPAIWGANRMMLFETLTHADTGSSCETPANRFGKAYLGATVPTTGDYRVWVRVKSSEEAPGPLALQVDSGCAASLALDGAAPGEWTWVNTTAGDDPRPLTRNLSAGKHVFTVTPGSSGLSVDQVLVTDDPDCVPVGAGCPELPADTSSPTQPGALAAGTVTDTSVALSWEASTDDRSVQQYRITRDGEQVGTSATLAFTDRGVRPETDYSYTVHAVDAAGNTSPASDSLSVTTPPTADTGPPSAPTGLASSGVTSTAATLSWSPSTDDVAVDHYTVLRNGTAIADTTSASYNDTDLQPSTAYDYQVVAVDAVDNASTASAPLRVTTAAPPDRTAPTTPGSLTARVTALGQVTVSWTGSTDNVGVTGYRIARNGNSLAVQTGVSYVDSGLSPGTTYNYTVTALDAAGNVSSPSTFWVTTPLETAPLGAGFAGAYFNNSTLSGPAIGRLDPTVNFTWGSGAPMPGISADKFSARWTGQLTAPRTGAYTFYTRGDNGVRLYLNDALLIDSWSTVNTQGSRTVNLTAGTAYNLRLEFFENTGAANMKLEWSGPSIARSVLPASVMSSASRGLRASYFSNTTLTGAPTLQRFDPTINFSWASAAPDSRLPTNNFGAQWTGKVIAPVTGAYIFWTDSDDGARVWVNNQLVIDNWSATGLTTRSGTINLVANTSYDLRVAYQEKTGTATSKLSWSMGTAARAIIANTYLRDR